MGSILNREANAPNQQVGPGYVNPLEGNTVAGLSFRREACSGRRRSLEKNTGMVRSPREGLNAYLRVRLQEVQAHLPED
jgi:hypothetical protein